MQQKFWINTDLHLTQYTMKQKVLDQHLHLPRKMLLHKKIKMAIYIKSTILKLAKN